MQSPFTILVDTREVYPWTFENVPGSKGQGILDVSWEWQCLGDHMGDYTIKGADHQQTRWRVSIERKSTADLYNTVLTRRRQFEEELENLNRMEYAAVVVEANLGFIINYNAPHWEEQELPIEWRLTKQRQVVGSIQAWQLRYPTVRWWFLPRKWAEIWVYRLLARFYEDRMKVSKLPVRIIRRL